MSGERTRRWATTTQTLVKDIFIWKGYSVCIPTTEERERDDDDAGRDTKLNSWMRETRMMMLTTKMPV
jgi:hypothetical protein